MSSSFFVNNGGDTEARETIDAQVTEVINAKEDAEKLTNTAYNTQYTLSDGTTGYSANHYSQRSDYISDIVTTNMLATGNLRSEALEHRNRAEGFKDEAQGFKNNAESYKNQAQDASVAANTAIANFITSASTIENYTATQDQTVFTTVEAYTLSSNNLQVYVNGVRQKDYTETDVNTVTFTNGLNLDDEVMFVINAFNPGQGFLDSDSLSYTRTGDADATATGQQMFDAVSQPNLLNNGGFDVWQRGTSFSALEYLIADRWKVNSTFYTGGTSIHTQQSNPIEGNYYQLDVAGHTSDRAFLAQSLDLESMPLSFFSGKTFTITYDIDSSSSMEASVYFNLRTVDGNNNPVFTNLDTPVFESVTTGRQTKSYTYTFPDLSGYSSQIQAGDHINFHILMRTNASTDVIPNGTYKFYNIRMEEGPVFTGWPHVDPATELVKCQRYYSKSEAVETFGLSDSNLTEVQRQTVKFPVKMRATPAFYAVNTYNVGTNTAAVSGIYDVSPSSAVVAIGGNDGDHVEYTWTADAEL